MSEIVSNTEVKMGSDKSFGLVFAAVFLVVAILPLWNLEAVRYWALGFAAAFAMVAFLRPVYLRSLNRIWFLFGLLLHKIVSPIIMGILFFLTVTPIGIAMRVFGKDPLNKTFDPDAKSYWIEIDKDQQPASSMRNQF